MYHHQFEQSSAAKNTVQAEEPGLTIGLEEASTSKIVSNILAGENFRTQRTMWEQYRQHGYNTVTADEAATGLRELRQRTETLLSELEQQHPLYGSIVSIKRITQRLCTAVETSWPKPQRSSLKLRWTTRISGRLTTPLWHKTPELISDLVLSLLTALETLKNIAELRSLRQGPELRHALEEVLVKKTLNRLGQQDNPLLEERMHAVLGEELSKEIETRQHQLNIPVQHVLMDAQRESLFSEVKRLRTLALSLKNHASTLAKNGGHSAEMASTLTSATGVLGKLATTLEKCASHYNGDNSRSSVYWAQHQLKPQSDKHGFIVLPQLAAGAGITAFRQSSATEKDKEKAPLAERGREALFRNVEKARHGLSGLPGMAVELAHDLSAALKHKVDNATLAFWHFQSILSPDELARAAEHKILAMPLLSAIVKLQQAAEQLSAAARQADKIRQDEKVRQAAQRRTADNASIASVPSGRPPTENENLRLALSNELKVLSGDMNETVADKEAESYAESLYKKSVLSCLSAVTDAARAIAQEVSSQTAPGSTPSAGGGGSVSADERYQAELNKIRQRLGKQAGRLATAADGPAKQLFSQVNTIRRNVAGLKGELKELVARQTGQSLHLSSRDGLLAEAIGEWFAAELRAQAPTAAEAGSPLVDEAAAEFIGGVFPGGFIKASDPDGKLLSERTALSVNSAINATLPRHKSTAEILNRTKKPVEQLLAWSERHFTYTLLFSGMRYGRETLERLTASHSQWGMTSGWLRYLRLLLTPVTLALTIRELRKSVRPGQPFPQREITELIRRNVFRFVLRLVSAVLPPLLKNTLALVLVSEGLAEKEQYRQGFINRAIGRVPMDALWMAGEFAIRGIVPATVSHPLPADVQGEPQGSPVANGAGSEPEALRPPEQPGTTPTLRRVRRSAVTEDGAAVAVPIQSTQELPQSLNDLFGWENYSLSTKFWLKEELAAGGTLTRNKVQGALTALFMQHYQKDTDKCVAILQAESELTLRYGMATGKTILEEMGENVEAAPFSFWHYITGDNLKDSALYHQAFNSVIGGTKDTMLQQREDIEKNIKKKKIEFDEISLRNKRLLAALQPGILRGDGYKNTEKRYFESVDKKNELENELNELEGNLVDLVKSQQYMVFNSYNRGIVEAEEVVKGLLSSLSGHEAEINIKSILNGLYYSLSREAISIYSEQENEFSQDEIKRLHEISASKKFLLDMIELQVIYEELMVEVKDYKFSGEVYKDYRDIVFAREAAAKIAFKKDDTEPEDSLSTDAYLLRLTMLSAIIYLQRVENGRMKDADTDSAFKTLRLFLEKEETLNPLASHLERPEEFISINNLKRRSELEVKTQYEYNEQFNRYKSTFSQYEAQEITKHLLMNNGGDLSADDIILPPRRAFFFNVSNRLGDFSMIELQSGSWLALSSLTPNVTMKIFTAREVEDNDYLKIMTDPENKFGYARKFTPGRNAQYRASASERIYPYVIDPDKKKVSSENSRAEYVKFWMAFEDDGDLPVFEFLKGNADFQPKENLPDTVIDILKKSLDVKADVLKQALEEHGTAHTVAKIIIPYYDVIYKAVTDSKYKLTPEDIFSLVMDTTTLVVPLAKGGLTLGKSALINLGRVAAEKFHMGLTGVALQRALLSEVPAVIGNTVKGPAARHLAKVILINTFIPLPVPDVSTIGRLSRGIYCRGQRIATGLSKPGGAVEGLHTGQRSTGHINIHWHQFADLTGAKQGAAGTRFEGIYTLRPADAVTRLETKNYIFQDNKIYQVRWDEYDRTWRAMDPDHPGMFWPGPPVKMNEQGVWVTHTEVSGRGGIGGKDARKAVATEPETASGWQTAPAGGSRQESPASKTQNKSVADRPGTSGTGKTGNAEQQNAGNSKKTRNKSVADRPGTSGTGKTGNAEQQNAGNSKKTRNKSVADRPGTSGTGKKGNAEQLERSTEVSGNDDVLKSWAGLDVYEKNKGHTIERHVEKNDSYLESRLHNKTVVSTFKNKKVAEEIIEETIKNNSSKFDDFWSDTKRRMTLEHQSSSVIGRKVSRDSKGEPVYTDSNKVKVIIEAVNKTKKTYIVLTAYPI